MEKKEGKIAHGTVEACTLHSHGTGLVFISVKSFRDIIVSCILWANELMKKVLKETFARTQNNLEREVIHRVISFAWSSFSMVLLSYHKICTRFLMPLLLLLLMLSLSYNSLSLLLLFFVFFHAFGKDIITWKTFGILCSNIRLLLHHPHPHLYMHSKALSLFYIYFVISLNSVWSITSILEQNWGEKSVYLDARGMWNYINKFQLKYQFVMAALHTQPEHHQWEKEREKR